jgi:hypothetical protein
MTITKEKFEDYVDVQQSGVTNMFNINNVVGLSGLSRVDCLDIMKNYSKYKEEFGGEEE